MNTLGWQELKVVALAVDDLARAEDFYRNKLGLEPMPPLTARSVLPWAASRSCSSPLLNSAAGQKDQPFRG